MLNKIILESRLDNMTDRQKIIKPVNVVICSQDYNSLYV